MSGGGFGVACASGRATGLSAGGNHSASIDEVSRMLEISRNYFAPGDADPIYQEVAPFTQPRQTTDEYIAEYIDEYISLVKLIKPPAAARGGV